ncbi:glycoside hydrolase family 5 protein [Pontixanthobacter sp. CEM42]|uniref:glycoside hydrolase family 5 protein n=1 Tax=Pontixanthobacter sp. CEM42 TaxID=2792077 RepID=UPI001ADF34BE|nr:glycoside hydrolase family 5 protein [Pontixanthobacter sp. CEM42]
MSVKLISAPIGLATLLAAMAAPAAVGQEPSSETASVEQAFQMKRCVNMGNALETPNGVSWGGLYGPEDYQRIAAAGFDTVRIPIRWSAYTGPAPEYRIHPDFMKLAKANVQAALDADLNVIMNIHHFEEIMDKPEEQMPRYIALWKELSAAFADAPDNVWFETLNEPNKNLKGKLMRQTQTAALAIIRSKNPERIVIFGGEDWSGIRSLGSNAATDDPNVVYTYHYYDPFNFTHQQATWLGDDMPKGKRGWGSSEDRQQLAADVATAVAFRDAVKRPVFVGEFGVNDPVDAGERVKFNDAVAEALEGADIPWCLWAYGNTFRLYTDEKGWDEPMLRALTD